ncbi:MAG TPA: SPOR domain-containing protein [Burkholderiaceae bacterium]
MLRLFTILLLLANAVYWAWGHGYLVDMGFAPPADQAEPQRLAQQIRPEALHVLSADEGRRVAADAAASTTGAECLQAGIFDDKQAAALRTAAAALPAGSWSLDAAVLPARWIVYMGRYADAEALAKKRAELRARQVSFEPLGNPALEPGLSLGGYTNQKDAEQALAALTQRGVRTARVVQERGELQGFALHLPAVDAALRQRLDTLRPALVGKPLRSCG